MIDAAGAFAALPGQAARAGLRLSDAQVGQCQTYAAALIEANRSVNLTAITDPSAVAVKHFLDSFTAYAARAWTGHERLVDVGSGAGFPGLALRIALPDLVLTCVEATGKKARAIEGFAKVSMARAFLPVASTHVRTRPGSAMRRARPGNPAPLPTSTRRS